MGLLKNPDHNRDTLRIYPWIFFPPKKERGREIRRERERDNPSEQARKRESVLSISISEWRPHRLLWRIHQLNLHPIPLKIISRYTLSHSLISVYSKILKINTSKNQIERIRFNQVSVQIDLCFFFLAFSNQANKG